AQEEPAAPQAEEIAPADVPSQADEAQEAVQAEPEASGEDAADTEHAKKTEESETARGVPRNGAQKKGMPWHP
ncbi:hypothetical protein Q2448_23515, partial [Escherichia coli]|nr:hypothetical protein [Escherichia coli]